MERLNVHGQELRVQIRPGDGSGRPLLICNGIGEGLEFLQPLVDALDQGTETIRFDVPGVGGSPVALLPYAFPTLAWLVTRMLDELGYPDEVDVLGYSWGGALAQQLAIQHPRRCRRLVLISTSTGLISVPGGSWTLRRMLTPQGARRPDPIQRSTSAPPKPDRADDARVCGFSGTATGLRGIGYLHQLAAIAAWTSLPFLPMIGQPTLVMAGEGDRIAPAANARILARLIPHSTLRVFPGGHAAVITQAPEFGKTISAFLANR